MTVTKTCKTHNPELAELAGTANSSPIPVLIYHQIAEPPPKGSAFRSLCVAPADFARQMALLRLLGYQGLSMAHLQPYLRGERKGRVVGITLDDGYLNNLTNALPILRRNGFSSTCYVVSSMLGEENKWDRDAGVAQTPLMTAAELRQWIDGGQEVGAHTRHHVRLERIADEVSQEEIALCRTELEAAVGAPVRQFCYPYGEYSQKHVAMVREAGYEMATNSKRSRCLPGEDLLQLPRLSVDRSTTLLAFWLKIATPLQDRHGRKARWKKAAAGFQRTLGV